MRGPAELGATSTARTQPSTRTFTQSRARSTTLTSPGEARTARERPSGVCASEVPDRRVTCSSLEAPTDVDSGRAVLAGGPGGGAAGGEAGGLVSGAGERAGGSRRAERDRAGGGGGGGGGGRRRAGRGAAGGGAGAGVAAAGVESPAAAVAARA